MRRILIERARRKKSLKCGGGRKRAELEHVAIEYPGNQLDLMSLDEALSKLERTSRRYAELVKLRFFAGLTIDQTADLLGVLPSTVDSDWAYVRSWLKVEMNGRDVDG